MIFDYAHIPEHLNAVIFSIGPVEIHWYGLMYVAAFLVTYLLALYRIRTERLSYTKETIADFMLWAISGVLIGGRLGYVLFYDFRYFLFNPLNIILPFSLSDGFHYTGIYGMSYHGGMLGALFACFLFCRMHKINFWQFVDFFIPIIPLGYTFGRLGNFINGELYGRVTTVPWGMYFPLDPMHQLRHPSQIYEALFEGMFLFVFLWNIRKKSMPSGCLFSLYLISYGLIRFFLEFFREPDQQLGFILGPFTMGQVLCFMMILLGGITFTIRISKSKKSSILS
jgi:phosphatidylglycerol:prolipoprotein diacylglycerol transferase